MPIETFPISVVGLVSCPVDNEGVLGSQTRHLECHQNRGRWRISIEKKVTRFGNRIEFILLLK